MHTQTIESDATSVFAELFVEEVEANGNPAETDTWQSWTSDADA